MKTLTTKEAKAAGMVRVGEFGLPPAYGYIWAAPADVGAVRAAYDAIADDDTGPGVLDDVYAAGGMFAVDD